MQRLFAALLSATFAFAPIAAAHAQSTKTEVKVAMLAPSALLWLHAIADQEGFYAKHNLTIRELRASDSPALMQAVASGSADAGIGLGDLAVRAIDKGASLVIAGAVLDKTILRLYGAKSATSIKDLAGKPLTAGAVRGGTANLLKYQLQAAGVDPKGVQMVSIANSRDRIIAMGNGQVAGALLIAPFDTLAGREGANLLDVYREPYVQTPLVLNKDWAKANRETAIALTQALKEAAAFINNPANKEAAISVLARYTKTDRDVCEDSYNFIVKEQKAIPADLSVPAAGLENLYKIDAAVSGGEAPPAPAFELSRYYDPSFIAGK
ncbi:hypothetical protein GCM10007301_55690 [Azorhizobium oxalatiphilum]|uniref:SsuA/THI5-like domain-containing protein n=1 Tax=Azorhizobium oxalatiphilum TaxID=980631 RepID=A0A917CHG9_9HYPH|nr:ABC transporter substrate-binding protein [Azorhizobium oxalatiphilum]GGF88601.1 hypothetical protein GCM10007301_55690 [Azorhizobium oxalatiphilum]